MVGRPLSNGHTTHQPDDLENAISSVRKRPTRFRDVVDLAVHNDYHSKLKRALKESVERDHFEDARKTQAELKQIKNKKVRAFYEAQNERLNDWLQVDALVTAMADDVLDSMNPQDTDGDGVAEVGGKLMKTGGDLDPLLPDDEREKRQTSERRAKWAINVHLLPSSRHTPRYRDTNHKIT